ncbi:hypothetical protein ACFQ1M_05640 [Sungkyunkwania multivorans]|uniref:Uncharacterized protein n=1 Tax=Sungkyunkwania multivorans TaxID=1173618 RepID=A0ABW3CXS7_9FLAO
MKNHKQAVIMAANKKFEALQTQEGLSVFFSVGSDGVFYVTREVPNDEEGWKKLDQSSALSSDHGGKTVTVSNFTVVKNSATGKIDMALIIKVGSESFLYLALQQENTTSSWGTPIAWSAVAYDGATTYDPLVIDDVYIAQAKNEEYFVVDILKDPSNTDSAIFRYYLDLSKKITGKVWNDHDLSANLQADKITSALGKKTDQRVDGIYTMGSITGTTELIYTPIYNPFNPKLPANPSRLSIPVDATAFALTTDQSGLTPVFVAGQGKLLLFTPDQQEDGDAGVDILDNPLFKNVKQLYAHRQNNTFVVWGLNAQGQIFYTRNSSGNLKNASSWSVPIPILSNVEQIASYLDADNPSSVIFAHLNGQNLIKLSQDPITTIWKRRSIVLPSTDVNDVISFNTFTTQIQILQDDKLPLANQTLAITSTSPVSVYIDNTFKILSPDNPVDMTTDASGAVTILQETESLSAITYKLSLKDGSSSIDINPMNKMLDTISNVKTGDDLGKIEVTNKDGSKQPLVPKDVSKDNKDATAKVLQKFVEASTTLPKDGSVKPSIKSGRMATAFSADDFIGKPSDFFGMTYQNGQHQFHEGESGMRRFGLVVNTTTNRMMIQGSAAALDDVSSAIESTAGDIFNWLKDAWEDVTSFFVQVIDGLYHFFVEIAGKLYRFILAAITDVVQAIEFVLKKIKVFFEDLIKWLGFLFKWKDILRSHDVLKNIINQFMKKTVADIGVVKTEVNKIFDGIEEHINEWAGLEDNKTSLSQRSSNTKEMEGHHSPEANFGTYHLKHGASDSRSNADIAVTITSEVEKLLETLLGAVEKEGEIFQNAFDTLKTQVIDQISTLSFGDIVKRLVAILADILVESAENIIDTALDIVAILVEGVIEILNAKLDIPVLSWLYKEITGNDLTILDVVCLIVAIPGTIIYKLAAEKAPFPDNAMTQSLIDAKSWDALKAVFQQDSNMASRIVLAATPQATENDGVKSGFIAFMRIAACYGTIGFLPLTIVKAQESKLEEAPGLKSISQLQGTCFFVATLPNIIASLIASPTQRWDKVTAEIIYGITAIQKLMDIASYKPFMKGWNKASKWIDMLLGAAGLVPSVSAPIYDPSVKSVTGALTNISWNANRIATPFADIDEKPRIFAAKMVLVGLYGAGQFILFVEELAIPEQKAVSLA